jgi:geranylgeranylglycerol-phosphate geranylgeranyltransferase
LKDWGSRLRKRHPVPPGYGLIVIRAMRPHFFIFPIAAALAGATGGSDREPTRLALICVTAGLGWGVGQLLNDLWDKEADKVDAPHRPAARGLLPLRQTLLVAGSLGGLLVGSVVWLHPAGLALGVAAGLLIATYNQAKRFPLFGNLSYALVIATATLIGAASSNPSLSSQDLLSKSLPRMLLCGAWAAIYLQANYEKDRRGDALAGYRTLAHVLGVRKSALLRAVSSLCFLYVAWELSDVPVARLLVGFAVLMVVLSALTIASADTEESALHHYRWTIHGGALGMLGVGAGAISLPSVAGLGLFSILLTELAFVESNNP